MAESTVKTCFCFVDIETKDRAVLRPCHHEFHKSCIERWFSTKGQYSCPECRQMASIMDFNFDGNNHESKELNDMDIEGSLSFGGNTIQAVFYPYPAVAVNLDIDRTTNVTQRLYIQNWRSEPVRVVRGHFTELILVNCVYDLNPVAFLEESYWRDIRIVADETEQLDLLTSIRQFWMNFLSTFM